MPWAILCRSYGTPVKHLNETVSALDRRKLNADSFSPRNGEQDCILSCPRGHSRCRGFPMWDRLSNVGPTFQCGTGFPAGQDRLESLSHSCGRLSTSSTKTTRVCGRLRPFALFCHCKPQRLPRPNTFGSPTDRRAGRETPASRVSAETGPRTARLARTLKPTMTEL